MAVASNARSLGLDNAKECEKADGKETLLKLERMKGLPRADFRAPVETEPMEICGPTHPRLGTGFSCSRNVETSLGASPPWLRI